MKDPAVVEACYVGHATFVTNEDTYANGIQFSPKVYIIDAKEYLNVLALAHKYQQLCPK